MAFGFIKKVFSFGRKDQPVEERHAEVPAEALPPAETEAPAAPQPAPASGDRQAEPEAPARTDEAPAAEVSPAPEPRKEQSEPPAAAPEPAAELPQEEVLPPLRQPAPAEPEPVREEIAPEPRPLPDAPAARPAAAPEPKKAQSEPPAAAPEPAAELPQEEVLPPLRQPAPAEPEPVREEIAPEPGPVPEPPVRTPRKVVVTKAVEKKAEPEPVAEPAPRTTWFQRLRQGLSRSSKELSSNIAGVFTKRRLDEDTLQDLEDVLIRADLGLETALRITDALAAGRFGKDVAEDEVRAIMAQEVEKVLAPVAQPLELDLSHKPHVILVVGVNGTGKTTTIGKLAAKLSAGGLDVMLAAGDTFRAAAIEQLKIWGERTGAPVIATKLGADAAGLAYDAFEQAKAKGSDVLIIDTAGRLQNKAELMAELEKIVRVLGKLDPEAPHTVLQTVDATTGQNALNQVEIFRGVAGVNGLVMTKLDGTARGGILVAIAAKHKLPVYFIGVGEQVDDLEPFSAGDFAKAISGVA